MGIFGYTKQRRMQSEDEKWTELLEVLNTWIEGNTRKRGIDIHNLSRELTYIAKGNGIQWKYDNAQVLSIKLRKLRRCYIKLYGREKDFPWTFRADPQHKDRGDILYKWDFLIRITPDLIKNLVRGCAE